MTEIDYRERGYLKDQYKIFRLSGLPEDEIPFHYHNFMKIFVLLNGNIGYSVEGKEYELRPYDVLLVDAGEIHRPVIYGKEHYERMIFYISQEFFEEYKEYELYECFRRSRRQNSHVIRCPQEEKTLLTEKMKGLTDESCGRIYAGKLLQRARLLEFLILLNHSVAEKKSGFIEPVSRNQMVLDILGYINRNLSNQLNVDKIAEAVHLNRSYLMHRFKKETGYTVMEYVLEKRLFMANRYISDGIPMTEVCYKSGFQNYSSFYRAYVDRYGCSPKKYHDRKGEKEYFDWNGKTE